MNSSLRDQLLAAGLVTEKQARQAAQEEQQRQFRNRARPGPGRGPDPRANQAAATKGARPNAVNPAPGGGNQPQAADTARAQGTAQASPGANRQQAAAPASQPHAPSAKLLAQQAQAAKVLRDQELNRKREEKAQRKARLAQIEQVVEQHRLPRLETDDHYSFIDGKKIRRMSVDAQRREQLTSGVLAIVRYKGHYAVVPKDIAESIRERDESMVVPIVQPKAAAETDEAYKDFVVPDDLMW
jgi:uncharacterized protein